MSQATLFDQVLPATLFIVIFVIPVAAVIWTRAVNRAAAKRVRNRARSR